MNQCETKGEGNSRGDVRVSPSTAKMLWFGQRLWSKWRSVIVSCGCCLLR
ncbi:hypothetical protein Hanom_Chr10g00936691 [Helianthus anomalus]